MVKVRSVRQAPVHYITLDDDTEVEVEFEPVEYLDILTERVGDKLVVGYLSRDDSGHPNPMKDFDGQGNVYLKSKRMAMDSTIWDNETELRRALHLDSYDSPDIDFAFYLNGESVTLRELATEGMTRYYVWCEGSCDNVTNDIENARRWEKEFLEAGRQDVYIVDSTNEVLDETFDPDNLKDEDVERHADELYRLHWREIVGPYVIPISYHSERGSTSIGPTTWDGDVSHLPDGVWVADKDVIENIQISARSRKLCVDGHEFPDNESNWTGDGQYPPFAVFDVDAQENLLPYYATRAQAEAAMTRILQPGAKALRGEAEEYAKSVLSELADWCDGNVYGVCVEVFQFCPQDPDDQSDPGTFVEGTWVEISDDAVWGHIGDDWAKQVLQAEFNSTVGDLRDKSTTNNGEPL